MAEADSEDMWFSFVRDAPATATVYQTIRARLQNLASIRDLVRKTKNGDQPLISTVEEVISHGLFVVKQTQFPQLQLDPATPSEDLLLAAQEARIWLLKMITCQSYLGRGHFIRLFRSILESETQKWSDLQHLYYALTEDEVGEATQRLRAAFAICLQGNFANKYAMDLARTEQFVFLESLPHSSQTTPAIIAARQKVALKAIDATVDTFACAVSLQDVIKQATSKEEQVCPICRESYLDFSTNKVEDLIADYPVRIKFCGHVIGKACLEEWMDTPLKDPARYPYKTCPMCRTQISGMDPPDLPEHFMHRLEHSRFVKRVRETTGLQVKECMDGVKRLMNEEVAAMELEMELEMLNEEGALARDVAKEAEEVLKTTSTDLKGEREVWMIPDIVWMRARNEWMDEGAEE
ncbi:hypothetical protein K505DRAFT_331727 [Melanomma pulvis-pyrius CBS 109.77]|uniref:RING-type domain-containing protein n=1 Tax=Melanomma pulvis-pyrius CBS 109.77 TaxID=1314802 RepID=A0A6A6XXP5_9PLEO|nr:hypothetical protein K505DRAFT_331727 [Melanomma pulvis-pyrius CBS 109.77]